MNVRATGSATSASSSAMRTSRSASWTLDSVIRASPRSVLTTRARRPLKLSNMGFGVDSKGAGKFTLPGQRPALRRTRVSLLAQPLDPDRYRPRGRSFLQRVRALRGAGAACAPYLLAGTRGIRARRHAPRRRQRGVGDTVAHRADLLGRQLPLPARRPALP